VSGVTAIPDVIGRVTMRSTTDTPAVRLGVRDAVGRVRLHAPGSSIHEILIVRMLDHRLDGTGWAEPRMISRLEESLARQLAQSRRNAVPLDGRPVPPGARAVVARDLTQLLCQYVIDIHDARVDARWWWTALAGRLGRQPVLTVLATHPREAPHVIADLVRRGRCDALDRADGGAVCRLLLRMAAEYRAPRLAEIAGALDLDRSSGNQRRRPDPSLPGSARARGDPWPEFLVTVAVQLAQDPATARSEQFARFAATVAGAAEPSPEGIDDAIESAPSGPDTGQDVGMTARFALRGEGPPDLGSVADAAGLAAEPAHAPAVRGGPGDPPAPPQLPAEPHYGPPVQADEHADHVPVAEQSGFRIKAEPLLNDDLRPTSVGASDPHGTVTELGGVLFLVSLVGELGLPDVFEPDWHLTSKLGAWGTLDLLARSLLPRRAGWEHDGVWDVLSELGGGSPFERARAMPARIPASLPAAWSRLGAGFEEPRPSLARTLAAPATQAVRRWLRLARPVVTGLLVERLGVSAEELPGTLLQRRARIVHDRTHVDVAFPLAAASVPVRRAGLDRDPGWVPELARVVTFQFDDLAFDGVF
jgi:hypothetical protein